MHLYHLLAGIVFVTRAQSRCLTDIPEVNPKRYFHYEGHVLDLRLEVSGRITHRLATEIFKLFLQEVLGYPFVTTVEEDDQFNTTRTVQRLSGPLTNLAVPSSVVNLEVWISPDTNLIEFTDAYQVKDCGMVAPAGRFGWFVPSTLAHLVPGMDHWRIFADQSTACLFSMSDKDLSYVQAFTRLNATNRFYCEESFCVTGLFTPAYCNTSCAVLLAGHPDETSFVVQHILEMKLFVKVVWVGPNLKWLTDALMAHYMNEKANRSLVLLSRVPSTVTMWGSSKFVSVVFPPCETLQSSHIVGCKYELQRLVKLVWSELEIGAKPAYEAVHKMSFSRDNYYDLLARYNQQPGAVDKIACEWLVHNKESWLPWIPTSDEKNVLYIGGIFPISGSSYIAKGIVRAAEMALEAVNANDSVLRDYNLKMKVNNGECKAEAVMKTFIYYVLFNVYKKLVGILGPACSDTVEPLAGVTKHFRTVVISYSAEGSSFSDRRKYPYFFRTIGENTQYKFVYLQLFQQLGWEQMAALTEDGQKYTEYISHMQDLLQANGITFVVNRKFPRDRGKATMFKYLEELKNKKVRIIIGDMFDEALRDVMCQAYHLKMTAKDGYVWFLPPWLAPDWYDTDRYNSHHSENVLCSTAQMVDAINGHLSLAHAYFAPDSELMQENITVGQWQEKYKSLCRVRNVSESNYAGFAYDAVWTYALALNNLVKEDQSLLSDLHSNVSTQRFVEMLEATDFHGVSGRIRFVGASRVSDINVVQWLNNRTQVVGVFRPNVSAVRQEISGGILELNLSAIIWLSADGRKPTDGKEPPPRCLLEGLATVLDVTCDVAFVAVNIIGFGLLGIVLIIAFLVVKRRYDKKVRQTQNYMKSLGIDLLAAQNMSSLDKWEISRDRVVINRKLGEGAFGMVYGGEALFEDKGWVAVAVKTLKVGSTVEEKLDFLSEAEVMKRFEHKNIVKLQGVCTKNEPVYTIMEFMLYGDMKTFLLARRHLVNERISEESDEISSKKLTMMAIDVARALSYLAELKYVHRDVASRNCLVNASRVVKLGDFGMTRPMYENDYYKFNRKGMLPVRWMAPESLALGLFSPSSDVWSYGVLLYEIITFGSFPFQGMSNSQVLEHVKSGNTLPIPAGVKPQLEGLIRSCWNFDHKRRPQVSEIVEFLANNPRLISPCLDVPLASVQMDDDIGQLEMRLPNVTFRKCSASMNFSPSADAAACAYAREPLLLSTNSSSSTELSKYMALNSEIEPDGVQAMSIL
ncbi:receptor-type guanylate cyclase gcy-4-like isoform X2 [Zootermopsis nevadensis]|uniref:receptor-type guanylate cyclase gcy-4-like isoform X2 n=1 Tax=Zootermopsis nevadensis TaxID=136037 RepID=UPI000B8E45F2|nr:receptor-type guanylate cyclase gcy-4-like isoform X2 [Zootermopsis nevadensis]